MREVNYLSENQGTMQQVVIDYYRVFRIYQPYRQFSEKRKLNKIKSILRNKLYISQTEVKENIAFSADFDERVLPEYKKGLSSSNQSRLDMFLTNQLLVAAQLQNIYYEYTSEFYNQRIHSYLLHPIMYYVDEDREVVNYVNVQLKIYEHGVAILIFTINESGIQDISDFVNIGSDFKISSAYYPKLLFKIESYGKISPWAKPEDVYQFKKVGGCKSINQAIDRYGKIVQGFLKDKNCAEYFIPYESYYIGSMSNMPNDFNTDILGDYKRNIVQLMDSVPYDLYTDDIVDDKFTNYKYGKFIGTDIYSNPHRSISVLTPKIIDKSLEEFKQDIQHFQEESNHEILSQYFTEEQLIEVEKHINIENEPTLDRPLSFVLILLTDLKTNVYFILEFMLMERLAILDYNQNFKDVFISESKLLKLELKRFYDWRNANTLVNSIYPTTVELFNWLLERTEDADKMRLIEYNREFSKEISVQKREVSREKLNIILSILSFLISIVFSFEPISLLLEMFEITERNTILTWYGVFNGFVLLLIVLIFNKEIIRKISESKIGIWIQRRLNLFTVKTGISMHNKQVKLFSRIQSIRKWFNERF